MLKRLRRELGFLAWLIPISLSEWELIKTYKSYGVPPNHRAISRIAKGDLLVFYVKKLGGRNLGGHIVGIFEVASDWYLCTEHNTENLPEEECKRYPVRIKVKPLITGKLNLWDIKDKLTFIKRKDNPSYYLKGTPANANRPLPPEDLELISKLLLQSSSS